MSSTVANPAPSPAAKAGNFILSNAIAGVLYPMNYTKVLMQLGYEPCAPYPGFNWWGRPILVLPGILGYTAHIYQRSSFGTLYDGVFPFLIHKNVSQIVFDKMMELTMDKDEETIDIMDFIVQTGKEMVSKWVAVIVAHPFHVIWIRSAAQYVGRECSYNSLWNSWWHIWKYEGILGYFSGLVPSLIYETLVIWTTNALLYAFYNITEKRTEFGKWPPIVCNMIATSIHYPWVVVTNCMIVTDSGLAIGQPPYMPRFRKWSQCWRWLSSRNELKRGGGIWFQRKYIGPQEVIDGCVVPIKCDYAE